MVKRFLKVLFALSIGILLIQPAAALAETDFNGAEGIFGEVTGIDRTRGTYTVLLDNGETITLGAHEGTENEPGWLEGFDFIKVGDRIGTAANKASGNRYNVTAQPFVKPENPKFTHRTGVISKDGEEGWNFQDANGEIIEGFNSPNGTGLQNGDILTSVFSKVFNNENGSLIPVDFQPFETIISQIGKNTNGDTLPGNPGAPDEATAEIVNLLGSIDQFIPPEVKTEVKNRLKTSLGESLPDNVWTDLPKAFGDVLRTEGWGFIPDEAFGMMNTDNFGEIPPEAFALMDTGAFTFMPPEAFGVITPEAFGQIPPGAFGMMGTDAFSFMPDEAFDAMKPEAFGQIPPDAQVIIAGKGPLKDIPPDLANTDPELFHRMVDQAFQDFWTVNNVPLGENGLPVPDFKVFDTPVPGTGWTQGPDGGWIPPVDFNPPAWWQAPEDWTGGALPDGAAPWQQWTPEMEFGMLPDGMVPPDSMTPPEGMMPGEGAMPNGWTQGPDGGWIPPEGFSPPDW